MRTQTPGFVRDVRFKNVQLTGSAGEYRVKIVGANAEHDVRGVRFEGVTINGRPLARSSPEIQIGAHVSEVSFAGEAKPKN